MPTAELDDTWTDERLAEVAVHQVPGVGGQLRARLLERFQTATNAIAASSSELRDITGFGSKLIGSWRRTIDGFDAAEHVRRCSMCGIDVIVIGMGSYPVRLSEIPFPPSVLYRRGKSDEADQIAVAVVGTRRASNYGLRQATRFARGLARCGVTIVSGLARGIDGAAHQAAMSAGGRTIAVLGSGIRQVYPPEHLELADTIASQGCLISELTPDSPPRSGSFPRRNRLISGLSLAVLVVEAANRSGALITARHAMEQNRDVMAVPGSIEQISSRGCHALIRDGAKLVETMDDVLEELGPLSAPVVGSSGISVRRPAELVLNDQEKAILFAMQNEDSSNVDELVRRCGLPIQRVLATVSVLESKRVVRRVDGNRIARI